MALLDELNDAAKDRERDIGGVAGTLTHSGSNHPCSGSVFEQMQEWNEGGAMVNYNVSIRVRVAEVGTSIALNNTVVFRGKRCRVNHLQEDPTGATIRLLCIYEKGQ